MGRKSRTKAFKTILINYLVLTHKPCFITFYKRTRILHPRKDEIFHPADFTSFDITIHVILWWATSGPPCAWRACTVYSHQLKSYRPVLPHTGGISPLNHHGASWESIRQLPRKGPNKMLFEFFCLASSSFDNGKPRNVHCAKFKHIRSKKLLTPV